MRHHRTLAAAAAVTLLASACSLPHLHLDLHRRTLPQTSFIYAADGKLVTTLHAGQNRVVVPFRRIPQSLRDAAVAIEDRRFYEHHGIDVKALLRAAKTNVDKGRIVEGGSTITEQYVKNTLGGGPRTLLRKIREAVLAWRLERRTTKDEILARYLNTVYFGQGAYGVQAAAKTYFSEPVWQLDLPQSALLAGLIVAPSALDPVQHPDAAEARRNLVLSRMREQTMISSRRYARSIEAPLGLRLSEGEERYLGPYFVQYVKEWFLSNPRFGSTETQRYNLLFSGGLRIYTTLMPSLQHDAERAVRQVLVYRSDPYGAMTVIDPRTGFIRAMVGGRDYFSARDPVAKVNLATGGITGRQAGSAFKPFALVAALQSGIRPDRRYPAPPSISITLPKRCGTHPWHVENYDGTGSGSLSLEQATVASVNVVYAQLIKDLGRGDPCAGANRVVEAASRMGIASALRPVPSAVLGTNEVNTLEMASAYGTLATLGLRATPVAVTRIVDPEGHVLYRNRTRPRRVLDRGIATTAARILQEVVTNGTGVAARLGRPALGKTGTAQGYRDAWFVGAIPQLVAAVWVGFPQGQIPMVAPRVRLPEVLGGTWPAQIWHAFMTKAISNRVALSFEGAPTEFVSVRIDVLRHCLPNRFTPANLIRAARFPEGSQPTEPCTEPTSYQPLAVPSVIGLDEQRARSVLESAGFLVASRIHRLGQPAGTVVAQLPAAGTTVAQASTVTLTVSGVPRLPVPDVVGMAKDEAVRALQHAGFGVAVLYVCATGSACRSGTVWRERPAHGRLTAGSTVLLWSNP